MKRLLIATLLGAASATFFSPSALAADVGVSVSIGQPGFYGRLDVGGYPPPQVIYSQPLIVERGYAERPPVYLRVPPGHAKHWRRHCREYGACGERVYFVQDSWYQRQYVPRHESYRNEHREWRGERHDEHRREHEGGGYRGNDRGRDNDRHGGEREHGHGHEH